MIIAFDIGSKNSAMAVWDSKLIYFDMFNASNVQELASSLDKYKNYFDGA